MDFYWTSTIFTIVGFFMLIGLLIGLFFVIKLIMNYSTSQKKMKSKNQQEWDKMNLEDLN